MFKIILVNSYRVEKSFWQTLLRARSHPRTVDPGLEQSRDSVLPEVIIEKRFKPFVEDRLPRWWKHPGLVATRGIPAPPARAG